MQEESKGPHPEAEEGNTSEVARLFAGLLAESTKGMGEVEAAEYLAEILEGGVETDHLFERLVIDTEQQFLEASGAQPVTAVREANLGLSLWQERQDGSLTFIASNALEVYLGESGKPLALSEALQKLRLLGDGPALLSRIILCLCNSRRHNPALNIDGMVPILFDELLLWMGHEKNKRLAHPGTDSQKRYTDGYRSTQKQRLIQELSALAACHVRGTAHLSVGGRRTQIDIDSPYLRYDLVSRRTRTGERIVIGLLAAPGSWIRTYELGQNELFAQIDRQIFQLNPQNDRYALRLSLYLTERWREQAKSGAFSTPITMQDLLTASMIEIDRNRLTSELAPKIEIALDRLEEMHIIGQKTCLKPADKTKARWGKDWLAARWEILPPIALIHAYQLKPARKKRSKGSGEKEAKE